MLAAIEHLKEWSGFTHLTLELGYPPFGEPLEPTFTVLTMCSTRSSVDKLPTKEELDKLIDVMGDRPKWYRYANFVRVQSRTRGLLYVHVG